jgi:copper chaperone NosL
MNTSTNFLQNKLSPLHRNLILLVALFMVAVYFVPLWYISLTAPQYPEGLSMNIYINTVKGGSPHDLKNINLLNHYIGMAEIVADSIPELVFMPYVLGYMIFGALVTFLWPRAYMVALGLVNLILVAIAGMYDFWRWEYNYGHNLNPEAPIVVPGMTYQPPLLGCKTLLNIDACSIPHAGAILLFVSVALLIFILYIEKKKQAVV